MLQTTILPPTPALSRVVASRVQAIDVVRGLVMIIMALDHVRELWSPTRVRPEDVAHASALLFFTRWVTHFCAPTFVFLSGTSIFLYQQKQPSRAQVSRFLLTRGLWLVVLELVVINFLLQWGYNLLLLQVIWAIGWGMVVLAGLIWLPRGLLAALAFVIIAGHNLLPVIQPVTSANAVWALLHNTPFVLPVPQLPPLLVAYSLGPWLGVMLAGYLIGPWFRRPLAQRKQLLRLAGAGLLVLFVALRATNWYGDPSPWSVQPRGLAYTVLSFINVTKYPPSLLFLCLTLGVALLLLSGAESATNRLSQVLRTFGQVPFFYYLMHLLLISGAAWVWTTFAFGKPFNFSFAAVKDWPAGYQPSLARAYLVWASVVVLLYLPCRWYQGFKQRHSYWWLSYL
ncbi:heparan-alpha-glucosaminide N-acetyltransferase domain-containing protein [Hymenobacter sp. BT770]|uniref:DUF1624 domain-containing protein n=1 Tax=Hymenobacter sp. BT770 TaxID=2886942 RepID=UPI001D0FB9B8|nr:heparan-alpha-glucosaminide N-acetyltransferase domain-containing protein [Hymenobacter sp. BT770]MCC3155319.1 heparan-alpha-glucosaminide N-acetyltransferase domain-containing protein [Hymenobacter sp. BT770]MDO3417316.1 heparan-alpha-glucosaminide N-acetyltransferase domain-containing protein [Hymenobacter sp. BT770]